MTEERLRELNGTLDLALLLAIDVIREHDAESEIVWQQRLIGQAATKLTNAGRFPGRLAFYSDAELLVLWQQVTVDADDYERTMLANEVELEVARRGLTAAFNGTVVRNAEGGPPSG